MLQLAFFKTVGAAVKALDKFILPYADSSDYAKRRDLARNLLVNILFQNGYEFNNGNDMKVVKSTSKRQLQETALYVLYRYDNNRIKNFVGVFVTLNSAVNSIAEKLNESEVFELLTAQEVNRGEAWKWYKIETTFLK